MAIYFLPKVAKKDQIWRAINLLAAKCMFKRQVLARNNPHAIVHEPD